MKSSVLIFALVVFLGAEVLAESTPTTRPAGTGAAGGKDVAAAVSALIRPAEINPKDSPLRQKIKQRHNTAVRILQLRVEGFRSGAVDSASVFDAARVVAEAKLDLTQNRDERKAAVEQILGVTRELETRLQKQFEQGVGTEANYLRARLARETVEIELMKLDETKPPTATTRESDRE